MRRTRSAAAAASAAAFGAALAALLLAAGCTSGPAPSVPHAAAASPAPTRAASVAPTAPSIADLRSDLPAADLDAVLEEEAYRSFLFFWEQANTEEASPGYGLVRDRWPGNPTIASIASVGFGLAALPVAVERGWIDREDARARALGTLRTFQRLVTTHGFFFHFLDVTSGARAWDSEVSIIDTGLLLCGALVAGASFGVEVEAAARALYEAVDWPWYLDAARSQFWMGYRPEKGFEGYWDFYAEQLVLYVLAAGSPTHPLGRDVYEGFTRHRARYGAVEPFIHSWFGSLFTHQYSHAFVDFRGRRDAQGVDWFANSVAATLAQRQYAIDNPLGLRTLGPDSWGLSAGDGPTGYNGLAGAPPSGYDNRQHKVDGTVPPYAAVASVVFAPAEAAAAARYYRGFPKLWGRYGFTSGYNLDVSPPWFSSDVIGIDKGITLLMLENHRSGLVWRLFMSVPAVQRGLERIGIVPVP